MAASLYACSCLDLLGPIAFDFHSHQLEHGFEGTSLEMLIEKAGGSRRVIYEHFGNKEGLFAATVESLLDNILKKLDVPEWEDEAIEVVLIKEGTAFVHALTDPKSIALFRIVSGEITRFPELGESIFEQGPGRAYERMSKYLASQCKAGKIRLDDPTTAARQILEMMKGELHIRALLCPQQSPTRNRLNHKSTRPLGYFCTVLSSEAQVYLFTISIAFCESPIIFYAIWDQLLILP